MKIGKNIHFLCGTYGSNIGIIKGDSEIAVVEGGWTAETAGLALEYIGEIKGAASLEYLFMTHADRDHVGGCRTFKDAGAKIVIHEAEAPILESPPPPSQATKADIVLKEDTKMKVGNLGHTLFKGSVWRSVEHDVCRFQVAVDNASFVSGVNSTGQLLYQACRIAGCDRSSRQTLIQTLTFNQFQHKERPSILFSGFVDLNDVGMPQPSKGFCFCLKSGQLRRFQTTLC